eukprot:2361235-Rhodomonas_salina.1
MKLQVEEYYSETVTPTLQHDSTRRPLRLRANTHSFRVTQRAAISEISTSDQIYQEPESRNIKQVVCLNQTRCAPNPNTDELNAITPCCATAPGLWLIMINTTTLPFPSFSTPSSPTRTQAPQAPGDVGCLELVEEEAVAAGAV